MDEYFEYFHQLNKQIHNLNKKQYDEIEEFLGDIKGVYSERRNRE